MKTIILLTLLLAAAGAAWSVPSEEPPKRQVIDLRKLEIEGSVPDPSTLFIKERSIGSLYELFPLRRELPDRWLRPVVKGEFDRITLDLVDRKIR